jgi:hypothetical protein
LAEQCDSCHAWIDWAVSAAPPVEGERPKRNPIDHGSAGEPAGNLEVWRDEHGVLVYRYLKKGEEPADGHKRGISHFATCPQAGQWRGRRRTKEAP